MNNVLLVLPCSDLRIENRVFSPLGLGYIASYLEAHGFGADIINGNEYSYDNLHKKIMSIIRKGNIKVLGFSVISITFSTALLLARAVKKEQPDIIIVFGGIHPTIEHYNIVKEEDVVDVVIRGDGEVTFFELVKSIYEKKAYIIYMALHLKKIMIFLLHLIEKSILILIATQIQ